MTSHIAARGFRHHTKTGSDFCRRYNITRLVYADWTENITDAIARERAMKKWRRAWKIELIERGNPNWLDLFEVTDRGAEEAGSPLSRG